MLSSSQVPESFSEPVGNGDVVGDYARAAAAFQQAEARARGSAVILRHTRGSADERARSMGRTWDLFGVVALGLFALATYKAVNVDRNSEGLITALAWFLPCIAFFLFSASMTLRYRALGARAAVAARTNTVVPQRRQWLMALGDLAAARPGVIAADIATKVEGHLKADDLMREKENRKLPWPARSAVFGASDALSERYPFAVDLVRWITTFVFLVAAGFLIVSTVIDYSTGMVINGLALVISAALRLLVTYAALVARAQRVAVLEHTHEMWAVVTRQDDDLLRLARDLQHPVVDLRDPKGANRSPR